MRHYIPLPMLMCTMFSSADIAEWKLCVCVKRTRFTAQMKRELWHPLTRRRGGNERIRSLQAFERWSTERLRAKRKNNSLSELYTIDSTKQELTCSSRDLKKAASAAVPLTHQGQASGVDYLYQGNRVTFVRFSWVICSPSTRNPCKVKGYKAGEAETGREDKRWQCSVLALNWTSGRIRWEGFVT